MVRRADIYCNIGESLKLCLTALAERVFSGHYPSRAECRHPSCLSLYQSSSLQDRNHKNCDGHSCRQASRDRNRFAYWPGPSTSPDLVTYVCIFILQLQVAKWII